MRKLTDKDDIVKLFNEGLLYVDNRIIQVGKKEITKVSKLLIDGFGFRTVDTDGIRTGIPFGATSIFYVQDEPEKEATKPIESSSYGGMFHGWNPNVSAYGHIYAPMSGIFTSKLSDTVETRSKKKPTNAELQKMIDYLNYKIKIKDFNVRILEKAIDQKKEELTENKSIIDTHMKSIEEMAVENERLENKYLESRREVESLRRNAQISGIIYGNNNDDHVHAMSEKAIKLEIAKSINKISEHNHFVKLSKWGKKRLINSVISEIEKHLKWRSETVFELLSEVANKLNK